MKLVRSWVVLFVAIAVLGLPGKKVFADEGHSGREPSSKSSAKSHAKKKKAKKKAAKAKAKAAAKSKVARSHKRKGGVAPKSHYPTQPGGSGFSEVPSEKADNLPAPQVEPTAN